MCILLAILYPFTVWYEFGGWYRLLLPLALACHVINIYSNHTELAVLLWDFPRQDEIMFSHRLKRLVRNRDWRGYIARLIAKYCNFFETNHVPMEQ